SGGLECSLVSWEDLSFEDVGEVTVAGHAHSLDGVHQRVECWDESDPTLDKCGGPCRLHQESMLYRVDAGLDRICYRFGRLCVRRRKSFGGVRSFHSG